VVGAQGVQARHPTARRHELATRRPGTCFVECPFSGVRGRDLVISLTETMTDNRGHLDEGLVARLFIWLWPPTVEGALFRPLCRSLNIESPAKRPKSGKESG